MSSELMTTAVCWEVGGGRWEVGGGRWEVGGGRQRVGRVRKRQLHFLLFLS